MKKCKCNLLHEKIIRIAYFRRVLPIIVNGGWNALFIETANKLMQKFVSKCYVADLNDVPELVMTGSFFGICLSIFTYKAEFFENFLHKRLPT